MVGYDCNDFVNIKVLQENGLAIDEFKCGICLQILERAVTTPCGHTYCHSCFTEFLIKDQNSCPKCQYQLIRNFYKPLVATDRRVRNNVVNIDGYLCYKNLVADNIIAKLMIKCKFVGNGCPEVIPLEQLETHLNTCSHKICQICDFHTNEDHNCVDVLKAENNELKQKLQNSEMDTNLVTEADESRSPKCELEAECTALKKQLKESENKCKELVKQSERNDVIVRTLSHQLPDMHSHELPIPVYPIPLPNSYISVVSMKYLVMDNQLIRHSFSVQLYGNGIRLTTVYSPFSPNTRHMSFTLPFTSIKELLYCTDPSLPVLFIKTTPEICDDFWSSINYYGLDHLTSYVQPPVTMGLYMEMVINTNQCESLNDIIFIRLMEYLMDSRRRPVTIDKARDMNYLID